MNKVSKFGVLLFVGVLLMVGMRGCFFETSKQQEKSESHENEIRWKETPRGVKYFFECVDEMGLMIGNGPHGYHQVVAYVGNCDDLRSKGVL